MIAAFGEFSVDLPAQELRRGGNAVPIQSLPLRLLVALLRARGELVTHAELSKILWPGRTVVFDRSLHTAIKQLRRVLGDDARRPVYIATATGRGYRILTPVAWHEPSKSFARTVTPRSATAVVAGAILVSLISNVNWPREPQPDRYVQTSWQKHEPVLPALASRSAPERRTSVAPQNVEAPKAQISRSAAKETDFSPILQPRIRAAASMRTGEWELERTKWRQNREFWVASRRAWAAERPSSRNP